MYPSEAKASHSYKMCTEISSSVPYFLHMGSFPIPIIHKCLLKVLCPVSRPIITLVWVILRDNSRARVARSGSGINSRACLCVSQVPRHNARCWFPIQWFNFILIFCLETLKKGSGATNRWAEPLLENLSAISFPVTPACPGTLHSPTTWRAEMSSNACWHCSTNPDVVLAIMGCSCYIFEPNGSRNLKWAIIWFVPLLHSVSDINRTQNRSLWEYQWQ